MGGRSCGPPSDHVTPTGASLGGPSDLVGRATWQGSMGSDHVTDGSSRSCEEDRIRAGWCATIAPKTERCLWIDLARPGPPRIRCKPLRFMQKERTSSMMESTRPSTLGGGTWEGNPGTSTGAHAQASEHHPRLRLGSSCPTSLRRLGRGQVCLRMAWWFDGIGRAGRRAPIAVRWCWDPRASDGFRFVPGSLAAALAPGFPFVHASDPFDASHDRRPKRSQRPRRRPWSSPSWSIPLGEETPRWDGSLPRVLPPLRLHSDVAPASDPSEADFPEPRKRPSDWWEGDHVGASSDRPVPAAEGKGGQIRGAPHPSVHNRVRSEVGGIHVGMASELATRAVFGAMSALGRLVRKNKPVMVLEPNRDGRDRKQALFVMMPGAFKDPSLYRPLAEAVQKECEERNVALYVTLSALPFGLGTEGDAQSEYQAAVEHVKTLGFDPEENQLGISDKVYVGGHSWGGAISRKVGFDRAQGVVLMGASCKAMSNPMGDTVPQGIAEWHKPMLVVAAELDGQARLPYAALDWQEAREASASADEPDVLSAPYKCVAVVEDMNHSQFCDGMPNIPRGDIGVAVQQTETVQRTVARIIADFIAADQLKDPACIQRMAEYNSHTGALVETYLNAFKEAVNKETAVAVQVHIAQEGIRKEQISAYLHKDQAAFVFSKPELLQAEVGTHCRVQYFVEPDSTHRGGRRNSRNRCSPTLWVKSKSAEAIAAAGGSEAKKLPHGQRAAEFNQATYAQALGMVSPKARERFEKYGRPLRFVPDYMATSGQDWVKTPVRYQVNEDGTLDVCCPYLHTELGMIKRYAGMHYVKVLSVSLLIEYILVDAFCAAEGLGYVTKTSES